MATDDEILARLIAKGAESRGGASEARAGGMESLREAMTAGQPTAQDAWTTAVAGALPALLGKLFGGDRGLQAGAEGGLVGAGTSMKLGADERARKEKYGALTAKTKLDQAKELDKDARLYDMEASKGGLQSAMQDERIESSEGIAKMQEGGRWGRHAENMALRKQLAETAEEKAAKARSDKEFQQKGVLDTRFDKKAKELGIPKIQKTAQDMRGLLAKGTAISEGQIATMLSIMSGEVGVKTQKDIERSAPFPISTTVTKFFNYLTGDRKGPIPKLYKKDILEIVDLLDANSRDNAGKIADGMIETYGLDHAPTIHAIASSYDGTRKARKADTTPSYSLEEIRAEKARRAAGGN